MRRVLLSSLLKSINYTTNHSTNLILSFVTFSAFYAFEGELDLQTVSFKSLACAHKSTMLL